MTGIPSTNHRRQSGDARVDRLTSDVRLAIGSRIEAMRAHRVALAEREHSLWEEPDRAAEREANRDAGTPDATRLADAKRLAEELRRRLI